MSAVVGIDLGTTNTVVAHVEGGRAVALGDENGEKLIPSVVSFHPSGQVIVGRQAKERRLIDAPNTIYSIKRLIGRAWGSDDVRRARERFPFELREGPGNAVLTVARGETYTLSEISAYVLRKAKAVAEAALGRPVERAVITVPANFNDLQRAATKVAGRVAGLEVLRILNEPTAAALAYGYGKANAERIAVYDFGGGTFDITLLDLSGNVFEVLATAGDSFLGGDDVDNVIADEMAKAFLKQHRYDPRSDRQVFERVRAGAEIIKHALSTETVASVDLNEIAHGPGGKDLGITFEMKRADLERLIAPLVDRSFAVCRDALTTARATVKEFDQVILVGGSTRIPLVRQRVAEFFQREPLAHLSPDEVVAIGAAIQAMALTAHERKRSEQSNPPEVDPRTGRPRTLGGLGEAAREARGRTDPGTGSDLPLVNPQAGRGVPPRGTQVQFTGVVAPPAQSVGAPPATADFGKPRVSTSPRIEPPPPPRSAMPSGNLATKPSMGADAKRAIDRASQPGPVVADTQPGSGGPAPRAPMASKPEVTEDSILARLPLIGGPRPSYPNLDEDTTAMRRLPPEALDVQDVHEETTKQIDVQRLVADEPPMDPTQRKLDPRKDIPPPPMPADPFGSPPMADSIAEPPPPPPVRPPAPSQPDRGKYDAPPPLIPPKLPAPRGVGSTQVLQAVQPPPEPPPLQRPEPSPLAASVEQQPRRPTGPGQTMGMQIPPPLQAPQIQEMRAPAAPLLVDVTPLSLSVETVGGYCDVIIARNTPVPCDGTRSFVTAQNYQKVVKVRVAQGESQRFSENTQLGEVELSGLREAMRGEVEIAVTFEIDSDGIVHVRARDVGTGREAMAQLRLVGLEGHDASAMRARQQKQVVV